MQIFNNLQSLSYSKPILILIFVFFLSCSASEGRLKKVNDDFAQTARVSVPLELSHTIKLTSRKLVQFSADRMNSLYSGPECFSSLWERIWTLNKIDALLHDAAIPFGTEVLSSNFDFYVAKNFWGNKPTLITGYYEPVLEGSLFATEQYRYPLYRLPLDNTLRSLTRRQIDYQGMLRGKGLEIVWLKSDIERFFLHIQGSGVVKLTDGRLLYVGFAGKNDKPYVPLGRVLIEQGILERQEVTMESIKRYLQVNMNRLPDIFSHNGSYVFFEERQEGAKGSLGVQLIAGGSFASDPRYIPPGSVALVPLNDLGEYGLMVSQDTGGAIRGVDHIDVFMGRGQEAGERAGAMKSKLPVYYLMRKECIRR
jgi:membrane-bound lytic murein transglycosylase